MLLDVANQLHQHFRIGTALEGAALGLQLFFQHSIIFDNPVVYQCQITVLAAMRMGIYRTGLSMGGPTRMGDSHTAGHILPFGCPFQIGYFSHRLIHIQLMSVAHQGRSGTIISAILQALQAFYQYRPSLSLSDISYNSTHVTFNLKIL